MKKLIIAAAVCVLTVPQAFAQSEERKREYATSSAKHALQSAAWVKVLTSGCDLDSPFTTHLLLLDVIKVTNAMPITDAIEIYENELRIQTNILGDSFCDLDMADKYIDRLKSSVDEVVEYSSKDG